VSTSIPSGARLGRYEVKSQIGAGGMGEVYLALDTELDRIVAVKILPEALASDQQRLQRFVQEAKAASALNHPHILTIYEIGTVGATRFIATEFIDGETLRGRIGIGISLAEILEIAIQAGSALAAAHAAGIIHRDIKPENIMVRRDGYIKLVDFGLAKLTEPEDSTIDREAPTKAMVNTDAGTVMGTVAYMSPEQAKGTSVDARSDLWSLGAVIYEMVAGCVPFAGETPTETISLILQREPPPLSRHSPDVPTELERIVSKTLTKNREERYQTAKDLLIDLRNLKRKLEVDAEIDRTASPDLVVRPSGKSMTGATTSPNQGAAQNTHATFSAEYIVSGIKRHKLAAVVAVILFVGSAVGLSFYLYVRNPKGGTIESIAVLPFEIHSNDADADYISDGITESIINSLTRLPNLRVIPRSMAFRYKGKTADPQKIGDELRVNAVLSGRIVQHGDSLTVSVELDDIRDGKQLWGEQYNRKLADLLAVQKDIASEISQRLRWQVTADQRRKLATGSTENPEAYQLYLKGKYYTSKFTKEGMEKGLQYFNQAIATDPNYALPYAGLAEYYIVAVDWFMSPHDSMPKAREAAMKALAIDDTLADAHHSRGEVAHFYEWDWTTAEIEFKRAIELNPNDFSSHESYSWLLLDTGRPDEAIAEGRRAVQIDPVSPETNTYLGIDLVFARRYDEAIDQLRKTVELDPNYWYAHNVLGRAYEASGKLPEAIAEFKRVLELENKVAENSCNLGHAYALSGQRTEAEKIIAQLKVSSPQTYVPPYNMATIYAGLGDKDQAFAWLNRAYDERSDNLVLFIKVDPQVDNLRSDPRFGELLRRIGLPQ
jgi:serine/threonine protein kinase/tetratricopeptide (TPR) repeat protein